MASSDKLVVFIPGMGAVATTFIAGVSLIRQGIAPAVGSLTQLGHLPVNDGQKHLPIKETFPMPSLDNLVFAGWDIYEGWAERYREARAMPPEEVEAERRKGRRRGGRRERRRRRRGG